MKRCPACSRVYDDDSLRFCLDDGSDLVDKMAATVAPPTLAFPDNLPVPTIKEVFRPEVAPVHDAQWQPAGAAVAKKRSVLPWLLGIGALLLLGSGIVVAFLVLRPKRPLTWHLTLEIEQSTPNREAAVKQAVDVIEKRLDALGISNFEVKPLSDSASGRILVSLPSLGDPERTKQIITDGGKLELTHVITPPTPAPVQTYATKEEAIAALNSGGTVPTNRRVLPYADREELGGGNQKPPKWVVVESPAIVDGSELRTASAMHSRGGAGDDYQISFALKANGAEKFGVWTGANINEYLAVVLNGQVKSIAYIRGQIFDQGEITGRFTKQSAEDLALVLKSGALPAPLKIVEEHIDK
jgi:protein-export membrane protein SecD